MRPLLTWARAVARANPTPASHLFVPHPCRPHPRYKLPKSYAIEARTTQPSPPPIILCNEQLIPSITPPSITRPTLRAIATRPAQFPNTAFCPKNPTYLPLLVGRAPLRSANCPSRSHTHALLSVDPVAALFVHPTVAPARYIHTSVNHRFYTVRRHN